MMATLTKAQQRALDWLPIDGSWRTDAGRLSAALNSLSLKGYCAGAWAPCGKLGGTKMRWWLTAKGQFAKAEAT